MPSDGAATGAPVHALPFSAAAVDRIVAEARTAFAHNLDLFVSLGSDAGTVTA